MAPANTPNSPLETVAERTSGLTAEPFEILGNDTRLAILLALWEAIEPGFPPPDNELHTLSFSELQERVGMRDSGQFNYHLNRLVGPYVDQQGEGYVLTNTAEQILRRIFAGTFADYESFEGKPSEVECHHCGGSSVLDYDDGVLMLRCTNCEGVFRGFEEPPGTLAISERPPAGLVDRSPQEFFQYGNAWDRHRFEAAANGVCPDCSGLVSTRIHRCQNHDISAESVCDTCGWLDEFQAVMVCSVCKSTYRTPAKDLIFLHLPVKVFFYERGLDPERIWDSWDDPDVLAEAIKQVKVLNEDPLELSVSVELDGDQLNVRLDNEGQLVDISEGGSTDLNQT